MSAAVASASRLAERWTSFYTRDLPAELRERRRREIASDVWEHEHAALAAGEHPGVVAAAIVLRVLRGMAADVTWRRTTLRGRSAGAPLSERILTMFNRVLVAAGVAVTACLGLFFLANGYGIGFGDGGDGGETYPFLGAVEMIAGALFLTGVVVGGRRPRIAVGLIAVGGVAVTATHLWMLPVNLPATVLLVAAAAWRVRSPARGVAPASV